MCTDRSFMCSKKEVKCFHPIWYLLQSLFPFRHACSASIFKCHSFLFYSHLHVEIWNVWKNKTNFLPLHSIKSVKEHYERSSASCTKLSWLAAGWPAQSTLQLFLFATSATMPALSGYSFGCSHPPWKASQGWASTEGILPVRCCILLKSKWHAKIRQDYLQRSHLSKGRSDVVVCFLPSNEGHPKCCVTGEKADTVRQ